MSPGRVDRNRIAASRQTGVGSRRGAANRTRRASLPRCLRADRVRERHRLNFIGGQGDPRLAPRGLAATGQAPQSGSRPRLFPDAPPGDGNRAGREGSRGGLISWFHPASTRVLPPKEEGFAGIRQAVTGCGAAKRRDLARVERAPEAAAWQWSAAPVGRRLQPESRAETQGLGSDREKRVGADGGGVGQIGATGSSGFWVWLPGMDSNHDSRLQRPLSYH